MSIGPRLNPLQPIVEELRRLRAQPGAVAGGIVGACLLFGSLVLGAFALRGPELPRELPLKFMPAKIVRLAQSAAVTQAQPEQAGTEPQAESESEPATPKQNDRPSDSLRKQDTRPKQSKKKPPRTRTSPSAQASANSQLPTVEPKRPNPFHDAGAWSTLNAEGDPWATSLMAALQGLEIPSFGRQAVEQSYQFRLSICPDGRLQRVRTMRSSGDPGIDRRVQAELKRIKLPPPPPELRAQMPGCGELRYTFSWQQGS